VELAKAIVDTWLASEFSGGRSSEKLERIREYECNLHNIRRP
jgi:ribose 5-phosphate isomerase B